MSVFKSMSTRRGSSPCHTHATRVRHTHPSRRAGLVLRASAARRPAFSARGWCDVEHASGVRPCERRGEAADDLDLLLESDRVARARRRVNFLRDVHVLTATLDQLVGDGINDALLDCRLLLRELVAQRLEAARRVVEAVQRGDAGCLRPARRRRRGRARALALATALLNHPATALLQHPPVAELDLVGAVDHRQAATRKKRWALDAASVLSGIPQKRSQMRSPRGLW